MAQTFVLLGMAVCSAVARKQTLSSALQTSVLKASGGQALEVKIYFEALCPDSVKFFQEQVSKVHRNVDLRARFNFTLYPYGNVHPNAGGPVAGKYWGGRQCQHGDRECFGNAWMACSQVVLKKLRALDHMLCLLDLPKQGMVERYWSQDAWPCGDYKKCVVDRCDRMMSESEKSSIEDCVGQLRQNSSSRVLDTLEHATKSASVTHVPWVMVNGQHSLALDDFKESLTDYLKDAHGSPIVGHENAIVVHDNTWHTTHLRGIIATIVCVASGIFLCALRHCWSHKTSSHKFEKVPSQQVSQQLA